MNRPRVSHLQNRNGTYYYRFALSINGRRTERKGSLRTKDYPTALQRLAEKEAEFRRREEPEMMPQVGSVEFKSLSADQQYDIRRKEFIEKAIDFYVNHHAKGGVLKQFLKPQTMAEVPTLRDIQQMMRDVLAEHERENKKTSMPLQDAVNQYCAEKTKTKAWSKNFKRSNERVLAMLVSVLKPTTPVGDISRKSAIKFVDRLNEMNLSGLSFNLYATLVSGFFEWMRKNQEILANPFEGLQRKNARGNRDAFTREQIETILNGTCDPDLRLIILTGIYTGMRVGEITALTAGDIRATADGVEYIDVNDVGEDKFLKTRAARRQIPINEALKGLVNFARGMPESARLFPDMNTHKAGQRFKEFLMTECGINSRALTFHSLRHTWKTELTRAGADDRVVSQCGGWTRKGDAGDKSYFHGLNDLKAMQAELNKLKFSAR